MEAKQVKGLMEAYASIYTNISEDHFKVGDEVVCKASGMEGEIVKLDKPHGEDDEKYYTVKREDGKTMKYAPNDLKLAKKEKESKKETEKEDVKEAKNGGATKKSETKFHLKLDNLVHGTFGPSPDEKKKMKNKKDGEEKEDEGKEDEGGKHKEGKHKKGKEEKGEKVTEKEGKEEEMNEDAAYDRNRRRAAQRAQARNEARARGQTGSVPGVGYVSPRAERATYTDSAGVVRHHTGARMPKKEDQNEGFETDLFDYLLEHLVAEGYADTNKAALAIMANMSEEWKQSIIEAIDMTKTDAYKNAQTKAATKFYTTPIKPLAPYQAKTPRFPALTVPDFGLGTNAPSVRRDDGRTEKPVPPRTEKPVAPRQKGTESQKPKLKPQVTPAQPKPEAALYKGPGYKKDTSIQDMIDRSKERQQAPKAEAPKPEAPRQPISAGAAGAEGVKFVERGSSAAAGSPAKPVRDRMVGLSPRERAQMGK